MTVTVAVLFFDMNSFFASVAQQEEPRLIGRPVGVLTTDAPGAACIAASIEAKRKGIRMGTRQDEARALCPDIVFRPARHDVCVRYHHAIRAAAEEILPIAEAHSVDEFSCHLMGAQQELPTALGLAQAVQANILRRVGPALRSSVGVAPSRLLAKLAGELEKPDGINWLHPSILPGRIAHLGLTDIPGISHRMAGRLERAGVVDIPGLYALAPKQARHIWGSVTGERLLRELHGETVIWPRTKHSGLGHGQVLTGANLSSEGARLVARRLLVKAGARLRREGYFARDLHVGVKCSVQGRLGQGLSMAATQDTIYLLHLLEEIWSRLRFNRPIAVNVQLSGLITKQDMTPDLFAVPKDAQNRTHREALCYAIDALNQRFGRDTVRFGQLPPYRVPYTGAKIAFGRIPEMVEFNE